MNDVLDWLRACGAASIPHPGGSLYDHLGRVAERLARHGADADECQAALAHAAYGTDGFPYPLLDVSERATLRRLIGVTAEEMVYRYGGCDRGRTWRQLPATGVVWSRFTTHAESPTPGGLRAFVDLSIANELDVYERSPEIAAKAGDYFRDVFLRWAPLASPAVMDDCRRVLGL